QLAVRRPRDTVDIFRVLELAVGLAVEVDNPDFRLSRDEGDLIADRRPGVTAPRLVIGHPLQRTGLLVEQHRPPSQRKYQRACAALVPSNMLRIFDRHRFDESGNGGVPNLERSPGGDGETFSVGMPLQAGHVDRIEAMQAWLACRPEPNLSVVIE